MLPEAAAPVSRSLHGRDDNDTDVPGVGPAARGPRYGRRVPRSSVLVNACLVGALAAAAPRATARADTGDDARRLLDQAATRIEQARQLRDLLALARALAYADPREVEWVFASAYGELLGHPLLGPLVDNLVAQYRGGRARLEVDAGAGVDVATPAVVSAAVAAAWELPLCRVVGARAAGLGGWEDGGTFGSYVLTGSACLPLPANTVEVAYTRRGHVRTSLLTVPVVLDDRRTGDLYDIAIRFYRYRGAHHQLDVMPLAVQIDVSRDDDGGFAAIGSSVETAPVVWRRRGKGLAGGDQVFRFMQVRMRYQDDDAAVGGRDAGAVTVVPLELAGIHVTPDVTVGGGGGYVRAAGSEGTGEAAVDVVEESGVVAHLQLDWVMGPVRGQVRIARELYPTYDAQFVVDDRIATRLDYAAGRVAGAVTAFAARDQVRREGATPPPELVSGGGVDGAYALGRGVHALARVEAAHALAAGTSAEPVRTRFEVRASAGVAYRWAR